ncbi:hypothetical protein Taro_005643 [Colocasia esculenta]|uniref:Uncharacterized protein n=1 Tax=Colocasia esculenta TaxID=4460 RepID=A0A843TV33_COLES|nr:hypothetical protein [Colocasia esculenta]
MFRRFGHLTPVRVAGVSVRPVALSRRPWGTRSCRGALTRRVKVLNATVAPSRLGCRRLKALAGDPFSLFLLPLSSPPPPAVFRLPLSPLCVSGEEEGRARVPGVVELLWSEEKIASPCSPPPCGGVYGLWAAPGWSIPWVCLSAGVATTVRVATPEDAFAIATLCPVATGLLSQCPSPSRWYHDGLGGTRQCLCVPRVFRGSDWGVGVCPRVGLPLGPSGRERGRLPRCVQLPKVTPSWPCLGSGARRLASV